MQNGTHLCGRFVKPDPQGNALKNKKIPRKNYKGNSTKTKIKNPQNANKSIQISTKNKQKSPTHNRVERKRKNKNKKIYSVTHKSNPNNL